MTIVHVDEVACDALRWQNTKREGIDGEECECESRRHSLPSRVLAIISGPVHNRARVDTRRTTNVTCGSNKMALEVSDVT